MNQICKVSGVLLAAVLLTACGKSGEKDSNTSASLSELSSSAAVEKAAQNTLQKGDKSHPLSDYRAIESGNDLMFLYYGLLNMPVDFEKVAETYSQDYRQTSDTFRKQDILKAIKPRIESEIAKAKGARYITWTIQSPYNSLLGSYEMSSKSFPIQGPRSGSYYYWNDNASGYTLGFTNADEFKSLPIADEAKAREIEAMVSKNRGMNMKIYAFAQDGDPSSTSLKAEILKIQITGSHGEVISE